MFYFAIFLLKISFVQTTVETLHFESGCLKESNFITLHLRCSLYEHIEIIRVIYGYSKQRSLHQCQFSIYDCIQEGASENILSCNNKQTCIINLTKKEIYSTAVKTEGVPTCSDFNYIQVNFACVPDAKDICDSWKEDNSIIHISHTRSRDKKYDECQCKIRSSLADGQVLLHAREMNRQFTNSNDEYASKKLSNTDCRKTTYLEIATDRSERKCMDNLPSNGNALFGSGSHNFTLTYVRNDPFSELFFYFELKASPMNKDHHVQIICNWARRTTTIRTTLPMTRRRKLTTINVLRGAKLSRLDLIRHSSINDDEGEDINELQTEDEDDNVIASKKRITIPIETTTLPIDEWTRSLSLAEVQFPLSDELFSSNNQTLINSIPASLVSNESKSSHKMSKKKLIIMIVLVVSITIFILSLYCLKVKQSRIIQRLRLQLHVALLFCCEAGKLVFSSSKTSSPSISNTMTTNRPSLPIPAVDYQSSEYYMDNSAINCHTNRSIYDNDGGKSIYTTDDERLDESEYMNRSDHYHEGDTC